MASTKAKEFSTAAVHEGSYVVYFNGIEVPVQSVQTNMGVWNIPSAVVNVAPDRELLRLGAEDRVEVQVFYLDDVYTQIEGKDPEFKLMFEGDIVSWSYTNTSTGRMLSFTCINQLRMLKELYPYFITGMETLAQAVFSKPDPTQINSVHYGPALFVSLLHQGMDPEAGVYIRRPYDFIENFLRCAMGKREQKELGSVVATNFFARQMRRHKFMDRFVPSPLLETEILKLPQEEDGGIFPILRALQKDAVIKAVMGKIMQQGTTTSAFDMIQQLFLSMYYEILAITPAPMAQVNRASAISNGVILGPPKWQQDPTRVESLAKTNRENLKPNRILNYITKPQWIFGVPPTCNVIFPSMVRQFTYEEDYDSQPTRIYINDERLKTISANPNQIPGFAALYVGYPQQVQAELDKKCDPDSSKNSTISGKNFLIWPEEFFRGPRVSQDVLPDWFQFLEDSKKVDKINEMVTEEYEVEVEYKENGKTKKKTVTKTREVTKKRLNWEDIKKVEQAYAHYEFIRLRGQHRRGAVNMIFNPYIVPGFPTVIFDGIETGQHVVGYVLNVTHQMSAGSMATRINFAFAQTLDEAMHEIMSARLGETPEKIAYDNVAAAPVHPVEELRDVTQMKDRAEDYFSLLFHQGVSYTQSYKSAAFYFPDSIQLIRKGDAVEATTAIDLGERDTLNNYTRIEPTAGYEAMFHDPDSALRFVSRPICSLDEYIDFRENGCRVNQIPRFHRKQGRGGVYYEQILRLVQGLGDVEVEFDSETNNLISPDPPTKLPDTRADWETRLKNYRIKVMETLHPWEA